MENITSHFIGITVSGYEKFRLLFENIQKLLGKNYAEILSFQDPHTIHITLYYLSKDIEQEDYVFIRKYLKQIPTTGSITMKEFNIFAKNNNPFVYYISPIASIDIITIHEELKMNLASMNMIYENVLPFVPHITLFKIKDITKFDPYKSQVEKLIQKFLIENNRGMFSGINLYTVDSSRDPEMQKIIF